jgi:hypothetical protein
MIIKEVKECSQDLFNLFYNVYNNKEQKLII